MKKAIPLLCFFCSFLLCSCTLIQDIRERRQFNNQLVKLTAGDTSVFPVLMEGHSIEAVSDELAKMPLQVEPQCKAPVLVPLPRDAQTIRYFDFLLDEQKRVHVVYKTQSYLGNSFSEYFGHSIYHQGSWQTESIPVANLFPDRQYQLRDSRLLRRTDGELNLLLQLYDGSLDRDTMDFGRLSSVVVLFTWLPNRGWSKGEQINAIDQRTGLEDVWFNSGGQLEMYLTAGSYTDDYRIKSENYLLHMVRKSPEQWRVVSRTLLPQDRDFYGFRRVVTEKEEIVVARANYWPDGGKRELLRFENQDGAWKMDPVPLLTFHTPFEAADLVKIESTEPRLIISKQERTDNGGVTKLFELKDSGDLELKNTVRLPNRGMFVRHSQSSTAAGTAKDPKRVDSTLAYGEVLYLLQSTGDQPLAQPVWQVPKLSYRLWRSSFKQMNDRGHLLWSLLRMVESKSVAELRYCEFGVNTQSWLPLKKLKWMTRAGLGLSSLERNYIAGGDWLEENEKKREDSWEKIKRELYVLDSPLRLVRRNIGSALGVYLQNPEPEAPYRELFLWLEQHPEVFERTYSTVLSWRLAKMGIEHGDSFFPPQLRDTDDIHEAAVKYLINERNAYLKTLNESDCEGDAVPHLSPELACVNQLHSYEKGSAVMVSASREFVSRFRDYREEVRADKDCEGVLTNKMTYSLYDIRWLSSGMVKLIAGCEYKHTSVVNGRCLLTLKKNVDGWQVLEDRFLPLKSSPEVL